MEFHLIPKIIVDILKHLIVYIRSEMTNACIKQMQIVLKTKSLYIRIGCGIQLCLASAVFYIDTVNIVHKLNGLFLSDILVQSTSELICDIVLSVRERTCTTESVHNTATLTIDTGLYFIAVYRTMPLLKRITVLKDCNF